MNESIQTYVNSSRSRTLAFISRESRVAAHTHHNHWPKHALALATSRTAHHKPTHHTMLQSPISQPSQGLGRHHASSVRAHTTQAPAAPPSRPPRLNI